MTPLMDGRGGVLEVGLVERALELVRRNIPVTAVLEGDARRVERFACPMQAVREALVNALVHRDYLLAHMGMGVPRIIVRGMKEHNGTEPDPVAEHERFTVRVHARANAFRGRRALKITVVNLEHAMERRERVSVALGGLSLDFELFRAVDGRRLTPEQEALVDYAAFGRDGWPIKAGALGCWLSHRAIPADMIDNGPEVMAVLEDDIEPAPELPAVLEALERRPDSFGIVFLHRGRAPGGATARRATVTRTRA